MCLYVPISMSLDTDIEINSPLAFQHTTGMTHLRIVTQNTYKYDLQPPSTRRIRDKNMENTNFVSSSIQGVLISP